MKSSNLVLWIVLNLGVLDSLNWFKTLFLKLTRLGINHIILWVMRYCFDLVVLIHSRLASRCSFSDMRSFSLQRSSMGFTQFLFLGAYFCFAHCISSMSIWWVLSLGLGFSAPQIRLMWVLFILPWRGCSLKRSFNIMNWVRSQMRNVYKKYIQYSQLEKSII